ncbi:MAG: lactate racemase domain-containing protein [Planctomycetota bacterium]|nr:lactate racemase domain-containing protein [Planctomycetota bacterium]
MLALEPRVPAVEQIVLAAVELIVANGIAASDITILQTHSESLLREDPRRLLPENLRNAVVLLAHHPENRADLGYLGADDQDQPIYINRQVLDADIVVPISCAPTQRDLLYGGVASLLYPTFADSVAQQRCRAARTVPWEVDPRSREIQAAQFTAAKVRQLQKHRASAAANPKISPIRQDEADHVAWLLGVLLCIQVVPGPDGSVLHVLAGQIEAVEGRSTELTRAAWQCPAHAPAELVVAAITGADGQQVWDNIGRALAAADPLVKDGGAIAICSELAEPPGPAMRSIQSAESPEQLLRMLRKFGTEDVPAARQWLATSGRAQIYLLSSLSELQTEQVGASYVADGNEIARLIERAGSVTILPDAQYALPLLTETE